jgi:SagB-type dehydrogenase family enzyme
LPASLLLLWREGVSVEDGEEGELRLRGRGMQAVVKQLPPSFRELLHQLVVPGADEDELAELVLEAGGPTALAGWYRRLNDLTQRGFLGVAIACEGRRLATVVPISSSMAFLPLIPLADGFYQLSRFAYLRREGRGLVLESPLAHARILLDDPRAIGFVGALGEPLRPAEAVDRSAGLSADACLLLLRLLLTVGMIQKVTQCTPHSSEEPPALQSWEFHDLLFHARVRQGRTDAPYGATYRLAGQLDPPPALKPSRAGESFELYRPDLEQVGSDEPRLAEVVERRRSIREYGMHPLTDRQLGEFLFRVARVTRQQKLEIDTPRGMLAMEFAARPYPAGGALYELEVYVAIQTCADVAPGLYYYDPQQHRLCLVCGRTAEFSRLVADAAATAGIPTESVQVVLILAARFQRVAWKYASIAYALILKHVGVMFQTMYLTATAMNLAPCALGGGDADLFARAASTDYFTETSVGEFLLGSVQEISESRGEEHQDSKA